MSQLYRIEHLQSALAQGILILTPNRRIAAKIKEAWGQAHADQVITSPKVYAVNDWLEQLSLPQYSSQKILSDIEICLLWENIVSDMDHGLLMSGQAIAELIVSADDLLLQWCMDYRHLPNDPDSKLLKKCIGSFEKELAQHQWTTAYRHQQQLAKAFTVKTISAPDTIVLTGFDDLTPLLKNILTATDAKIITSPAPKINSIAQRTQVTDTSEEVYAAATWALQQLREHRQSGNTDISIGIILPDLNHRRHEVERILQTVFEPQTILPDVPRYSPPFNISAGEPLAEQPVIASAIQLLGLNHSPLTLNDLLSLLHSPFWSNYSNETTERIQAENKLRENRWDMLSITDLRNSLADGSPLLARLNQFEKSRIKHNKTQLPSEWLGSIQEQLTIFGWPGTRRLDSVEYQQVVQFQQVLDQFLTLDNLLGKISFHKAMEIIRNLCRKTIYHAQTQESPIQILGILEGSGLHFDAIWICGMSEKTWPPLPKPHPLLPLTLQMEHNMPHCSVTREQQYCKNITGDLLNSAKNIVISFPEQIDESNQRISSLFLTIKDEPIDKILGVGLSIQHPYLSTITNHTESYTKWELVKDSKGPIFNETKAQGGQSLIKAQAQNPFDAFARYRLNAKTTEEPEIGLPKFERGNLIHSALYYFWNYFLQKNTANDAELHKLENSENENLIKSSIEFALRKSKHSALLNENFRAIEIVQLTKHLKRWLNLEKQRKPFTVVALEKSIKFILNGVELSLTIDRIDQLADGSFLLIDYKTTSANLSSTLWQDQRPQEPQLPLYSLANENTSGISFAQVNIMNMKFISMGTHLDIPSLTENKTIGNELWKEQQLQWQQHLVALMQEFKDGCAYVQYHHEKIPEHNIALQALNRWPEKALIDELLQEKNPHD